MKLDNQTITLRVSDIEALCQRALQNVKASPEAIAAVTDALVWCELHGISSHGLNMLPIYLERARHGGIDPQAIPRVIQQRSALLSMDGCGAFGQLIGRCAIEQAMTLVKVHGVGVVSVFNGNHAGALGRFTQLLAEAGMVGFMAHNANPAVAPFGGKKAAIGTNPLSFAFPGTQFPIVVDLATSATAKGKLYDLARSGDVIPPGLALDANGEPTTSLAEALKGILLPLGGAKGYSLAVAVEMLTGVLSGGLLGPDVPSLHNSPNQPQGVSMFIMALDVAGFMPIEEYKIRAGQLERKLSAIPAAQGFTRVQIPGEHEAWLAQIHYKQGIPIKRSTYDEIMTFLKSSP